jgi:aminopeptidase N
MKFNRVFVLLFVFSVAAFAQTLRVKTYDVQHYIIRTSFDRAAQIVYGDTTIRLKPLTANFNAFTLDARNMQIESVALEDSNQTLKFVSSANDLQIALDKNYSPADLIGVRVKYKTQKPAAGIFFVEAKKNRSSQVWTQGEPEDNRFWFPSYDFPDDKATSEQFITVDEGETAIANGVLLDVKTNENRTRTFHYRMDIPHSSYLISLVVGKYVRVEAKHNDIPLGFYVYPGTESIVSQAFGKTAKMMDIYEKLLGVKFPFPKYDQVVAGDFDIYAGMENITATTLTDSQIYNTPKSDKDFKATEELISHELAHSWFGNLVTTKDWANLWLNEGFATFMEAAFAEQEYGRAAYLQALRKNAEQYFVEEAFVKHPLLNERAKPNVLLFDATTYQKGSFVIHMLRETVGDMVFWKSIRHYLEKHRFGNVETTDLQRAFEETSGKNLDWFFNQWIRQAGYPNLVVRPFYNKTQKTLTLTIAQTQKEDSQTPAAFRFNCEVVFVTNKKSQTEKIEITERTQSFTFKLDRKPDKIIFDSREQVLKKLSMKSIAD